MDIESFYQRILNGDEIHNNDNINYQNKHGTTLLHYFSLNGESKIVKRLIEEGALVTIKDYQGNVPLHGSATGNHKEITKLILDAGANVNEVNIYGNTPLHFACTRSSFYVAKLLLEHGADPYITNNNGLNCFDVATVFLRQILDDYTLNDECNLKPAK